MPRRGGHARATCARWLAARPVRSRRARARTRRVARAGARAGDRAGRSADGRRTGRRVAASGRRGAAGRRGRRARRSTPRAGPRASISPRCRSGPARAGTSWQTASPEAISWCRTTFSRSYSPSCPRTSSASSPGPPCSTGCRARCATRSWRTVDLPPRSSRCVTPICSWCRSIPAASGTGITTSSRNCSDPRSRGRSPISSPAC